MCRGGCYSIYWIALLTLDLYLINVSVKQWCIKCHFFMTWPEIEPLSLRPLVNILINMPMGWSVYNRNLRNDFILFWYWEILFSLSSTFFEMPATLHTLILKSFYWLKYWKNPWDVKLCPYISVDILDILKFYSWNGFLVYETRKSCIMLGLVSMNGVALVQFCFSQQNTYLLNKKYGELVLTCLDLIAISQLYTHLC